MRFISEMEEAPAGFFHPLMIRYGRRKFSQISTDYKNMTKKDLTADYADYKRKTGGGIQKEERHCTGASGLSFPFRKSAI
jgi:hypothetical protein